MLISSDSGPGSVGVHRPDTLPHLFTHLLNKTGLWLLHVVFRPYFCCVTHPRVIPPIHSFSPSCSRLTVTVSSPLITVPLSYNCRSKKLSSCLSSGSTLGGKLEHYIKTMWARLVCGCVCVCVCANAHAGLCLPVHLFVCIPLHEVKRLLQNVNDDRESGLHVNNSKNNMKSKITTIFSAE